MSGPFHSSENILERSIFVEISLQNLIQYRIKALITNLSQEIKTQGSKKEIIKS
jgi:hypothetical protein